VRTLLYQQPNLEIHWDEKFQWIYADWMGYQTVAEIERGCEQILRLLTSKNCDSVLNDNRRVEGIWSAAAEWVGKVWFADMRRSGLRQFAWIVSPARMSQVSTDEVMRYVPPGLVKLFDDYEPAVTWLYKARQMSKAKTQPIYLPPQAKNPR
jgi:hypothetical protein